MPNFKIHITGRVQGVGFRPFVYTLARKYGFTGWVRNGIDGIHIEIEAARKDLAESFYRDLINSPPELSIIKSHRFLSVDSKSYDHFSISKSSGEGEVNLLISPDFAICESCHSDLFQPDNHRHNYPFITCTKCGPRYSIIHTVPYDRECTTMNDFLMCPNCQNEYDHIWDRRYYAQTNSCPQCPVSMTLWDSHKNLVSQDQKQIIEKIKYGVFYEHKIFAIKGIGGYLLIADATDSQVLKLLRSRKHRIDKPFALMYPNREVLQRDVILQSEEIDLLTSPIAPILLTKRKRNEASRICDHLIAPGLDLLGVMLPYTGLYAVILKDSEVPIVATSGNISDTPIIFDDDAALEELSGIADYIVTNDRKILIPQDDSVIRITSFHQKKIIIRRSRGLAPNFDYHHFDVPNDECILAMGADLKATFSIYYRKEIFTSQYLGDLSDLGSIQSYELSLHHMLNVLQCVPDRVLIDAHPEYMSCQLGMKLADQWNIPKHSIQHHQAHCLGVIAEHDLINQTDPILGVVWDGTGYGDDGQIWGGEFFEYKNKLKRIGHIQYFPNIGGDRMAKEPRQSALSLFNEYSDVGSILSAKFSDQEMNVYKQLLSKDTALMTSSMGRVFDAVASILGICDHNYYEGYAGTMLENFAQKHISKEGIPLPYELTDLSSDQVPLETILRGIVQDVSAKADPGYIATRFHLSLVSLIEQVAKFHSYRSLVFSGGVFQNALLVDLIISHLGKKFKLYFHNQLSPNDENISYGQIAHYAASIQP